ncbi:MAG: S46 family peptidase [Melioribacteraceae bacterium]|nr:S46 family peptidase [Melioribacteraceae bacterium]
MKKLIYFFLFFSFISTATAQSIYEPIDLNKVESSLKDMGKMWTFDSVPVDYFEKEYGFKPSEEWIKEVMMSALQYDNFCSAAFVSADGLIMTNHHCGRSDLPSLSPEGKDYLRDGFWAENMSDEIKVPKIFFDQLMQIVDVTDIVISEMNTGKDDIEKVSKRELKIKELEDKYSKENSLVCKVVKLYNGGKYSLYMYKRYTDIRLVMAPDFQIASTGWDWDNFTYPRYELDFMFYRAYENDKPVKTNHFFKFSKNGAKEGETVFVIGRPGSTNRLDTYAQLEYYRDYQYKYYLGMYNEFYKVAYDLFIKYPERETELLNSVMSIGNGRKSFAGRYMALRDDFIMTKKKDFEKKFKEKVNSEPSLKAKYGHVWKAIEDNIAEYAAISPDLYSVNMNPRMKNIYLSLAEKAIEYANQMKLPEADRKAEFKSDKLEATLAAFYPPNIDKEYQDKLFTAQLNYIGIVLGKENEVYKNYSNAINKSAFFSKEKTEEFLKKSADEILACSDPLIVFAQYADKKLSELRPRVREINSGLQVLEQLLGEAAYAVFGEQIPPDATSTLRISDGRVEGYEYNGTLAPAKTTYFGLYDRWNSFGRKSYPWGLHPRWQNIPEGMDLATPIAFASSNDIVGGNSGSSLININREVIGIAHDGNLESLAGDFIFLQENNRTVSSDSWGLMESLKHVFKTDRLVKELENGKIIE